jgi:nitrogenase molybdenum-iron protein alpha/beta subunit
MREGYADEVYIVTSGEIASLYAANNIAKGVQRFSGNKGKLAGIIGNGRGTKDEQEVIAAFAQKIGTRLVAFVPRSESIAIAELHSKTIVEFLPNSELANIFRDVANYIEKQQTPITPTPLTDSELEDFLYEFCYDIKQKPARSTIKINSPLLSPVPQSLQTSAQSLKGRRNLPSITNSRNTNFQERAPTYGCSLAGAFNVIRQIRDSVALMYSPQGCSYISFCTHMSQSSLSDLDMAYLPNLLCTNMTERDVIFGGSKSLAATLENIQKRFPGYSIFLVTACIAGLIGDDVEAVIKRLVNRQKIIHIATDGVIGGDFSSGVLKAYQTVAEEFIDETVDAEAGTVNLIGEQNLSVVAESNFLTLKQLLTALDITVNCRFIRKTALSEIRNFKKAEVNIPMVNDPVTNNLTSFLRTRFNVEIFDAPLPFAFEKTNEFLCTIGHRFGKDDLAKKIVNVAKRDYESQLFHLRKFFSGKKALILNSESTNIDWLISTLTDLGVDISRICSSQLYYPQECTKEKNTQSKIQVDSNFPVENYEKVINEIKPDFVLTAGFPIKVNSVPCDAFPVCPPYGFNGGLDYAKNLYNKLRIPFLEGWRYDENLF